ncbi:hypothetical protein PV433_30900 [Paenibacillus sp. GYB004]|uniref:hypothetical protein n=1 Tax=Paenibacillus sp. GYB004 TaxID=2994393 RepID=UPI002F96146B
MLSLNGKAEETITKLLQLIDQVIQERNPAEAVNTLPGLVTATAELIKAVDR